MLRSDVATLIALDLSTLLATVQMEGTDTTGNLKEPIDRALRAMGVASAVLPVAEPANEALFEAQATYEALRTIARRLGDQFDMMSTGNRYLFNQMFTNVQSLLDDAAKRVIALGGSTGGAGIIIGTADLGFQSTLPEEFQADTEWVWRA